MSVITFTLIVVGPIVGFSVAWFFRGREVLRLSEKVRQLQHDLEIVRQKIVLRQSEVIDVAEEIARSLGQIANRADRARGERDAVFSSMSTEIDTIRGASSNKQGDAMMQQAELAVEALAASGQDLTISSNEFHRRMDLFNNVLGASNEEEKVTEARVRDLVQAADLAVGAASAMDSVIRKLQSSATETAELSTQVSTEAERGYRAVHRTLDEIERIRNLTGVARSRIGALGERVSDIGHVVKVIHDITEKTNLLALNASIIAAQAGEHGRSFAVVAREIKALAQRTAASTKEISEQIRSVQEESERATSAMVDGVSAVGEGFQVAIAAGDALDAIRQSARAAQKRVQSITRNLRQQNTVAHQVVESAASVSERATIFANAVRGQTTFNERLRAAADELKVSGDQVVQDIKRQTCTAPRCAETIQALSEHVSSMNRHAGEFRRGVNYLLAGSKRTRTIGDDLGQAIEKTTSHLGEAVDRLRN